MLTRTLLDRTPIGYSYGVSGVGRERDGRKLSIVTISNYSELSLLRNVGIQEFSSWLVEKRRKHYTSRWIGVWNDRVSWGMYSSMLGVSTRVPDTTIDRIAEYDNGE